MGNSLIHNLIVKYKSEKIVVSILGHSYPSKDRVNFLFLNRKLIRRKFRFQNSALRYEKNLFSYAYVTILFRHHIVWIFLTNFHLVVWIGPVLDFKPHTWLTNLATLSLSFCRKEVRCLAFCFLKIISPQIEITFLNTFLIVER